jgi:K+/H+ antiporter YhaU regulatory subunit KhtT
MIAIVSLLVVVVLSLVVTRVGAVALRLTGMSQDAARFQARSALTGSGFTTSESEQVVSHPVRRRIVGMLMLLGNIGLVAASGTLIVSLVGIKEDSAPSSLFVLIGGLIALYLIASSKAIDRLMCSIITWALGRYTDIETRDFSTLLHLHGDYQIGEINVLQQDAMAGLTLAQAKLKDQGVLVLGIIDQNNEYEGMPSAHHLIEEGQTLIIYGLPDSVQELDCRCNHKE